MVVILAMLALGVSFAQAKDENNLDQYDEQIVADVIEMENNFLYPALKMFWPSLIKPGQGGEKVTSDVRLVSNLILAYYLNAIVETFYSGIVNNSSCGEESVVKASSWQVRMVGGLPGYCYFIPEKRKLKIERVSLQSDGSGWIKNIVCARDITSLEGIVPGQEGYILEILSTTFSGFQWGNLIWNPDDNVLFAVEVISLPAEYLSPVQ